MSKLIGMGDCIIDFLPSAPGEMTYTAKMGGAPVNVCAAVAKLGGRACYLGKLADDNFGKLLLSELGKYGVDTSLTVVDGKCNTGLAFVDLHPNGDRDFFFYRDVPADANLSPDEVKEEMFEKGDVLHFCSVSLMESPTKHAIERAAALAHACGAVVSFDVNLRLHLWKDAQKLHEAVTEFLPYADFVKVTDDELEFITGLNDEKEGIKALLRYAARAKLIFVTRGGNGSAVYDREANSADYAAYPADVVDTTGAGDCFIGSIIWHLLNGEAELTVRGTEKAMNFAVRACACVISKKGGAPSMPSREEVEKLK